MTSHPSFLPTPPFSLVYRIQYWECCSKKKRAGPGCQPGPHPDPFALRRKPFFAAAFDTATTTGAFGGSDNGGHAPYALGVGLDGAQFCQVLTASPAGSRAVLGPPTSVYAERPGQELTVSEPDVCGSLPALPSSSDLSVMSATPPRKHSDGDAHLYRPPPLPLPLLPPPGTSDHLYPLPQPPSPTQGRPGAGGSLPSGKKKVVFDYDSDVLGR